MKIILVGYPGSQKIVPITKILLEKYMPEYELVWLNYTGPVDEWSKFNADYLKSIDDELVIFTLDDYLIAEKVSGVGRARELIEKDVKCVRLLTSERKGEQLNYSVTAQYNLWDRLALIDVLEHTKDPWDFEINGTRYFDSKGWKTWGFTEPIVRYSDCSALSTRHPGKINVLELNDDDIKLVLKYYNEEDLILGQKRGDPVLWKDSL